MYILLYKFLVYFIATIHLGVIGINLWAIPMVAVYEPVYISVPIITVLVSPLVGSTYCMFNKIENYYRGKINMPFVYDRSYQTFKYLKEKLWPPHQ